MFLLETLASQLSSANAHSAASMGVMQAHIDNAIASLDAEVLRVRGNIVKRELEDEAVVLQLALCTSSSCAAIQAWTGKRSDRLAQSSGVEH